LANIHGFWRIVTSEEVEVYHVKFFLDVRHLFACGNLTVLVHDLVKQRHKLVEAYRNYSGLLVRYRSLVGLGVDLLNTEVDVFFGRDVGHGFAMLVSPLVLFFHPLDPMRVVRVEG
jgi:hypothetical protein